MNASQFLYSRLKAYDEALWVAIAIGQSEPRDSGSRQELRNAIEEAHWAGGQAKRLIKQVRELSEQGFNSPEDALTYMDEVEASEDVLSEVYRD